MKCLLKYQWVKLPRNQLPPGKGIMASWARLASRAAFRTGQARYCGYTNKVSAGGWAGGIVGLKSILAIKRRRQSLEHMDTLADLGYITYSLDTKTKKLTYQVTDWVVRCSGEPCMGREAVYATEGYGFLCLPRNVTQRLAERHYQFAEADAWLDLWCHTVWQESSNAFSFSAPAVQFGQYGAVLTLESLGRRWGWEKTKVWRFFRKHADAFPLYKLPGAFGCLIFNAVYPTGEQFTLPSQDKVERILREIRTKDGNTHENQQSDHARICKLVAWYSRAVLPREQEERRVASEDCYIMPKSASAPVSSATKPIRRRLSRRSHRLSPCLLNPTWTNRPDRRLPPQQSSPLKRNRHRQSRRRPSQSRRHPAVSPRNSLQSPPNGPRRSTRAPGRRRIFNCPPP